MLITLPQELAAFANGQSEVTVKGSTPKTALTRLYNSYPRLYMHMLGPEGVADRYACVLDDEFFLDSESVSGAFKTLEFVEVPSGADPFTATVFIAEALLLSAEAATVVLSAMTFAYAVVGYVALGVGISMLSSMLGPGMPGMGSAGSVGGSSSASFNGVQNTTAPGTPVSVVYGKHRVGGQALNVSISTTTSALTTSLNTEYYDVLTATFALGEGPIAKVEKTLINGYPTTYFSGWVDGINDISYSYGTSDVADVVTYNPASTTVEGDMSTYDVIQNTINAVNNPTVLSVAEQITYNNTVTEGMWVNDPAVPESKLAGTWYFESQYTAYTNKEGMNSPAHWDASKSRISYGGADPLEELSAEIVAQWGRDNSCAPLVITDYKVSQDKLIPIGQNYNISPFARDKVVRLEGGYYITQRQIVPLESVITWNSSRDAALGDSEVTKIATTRPVVGFRVKMTLPYGLYTMNDKGALEARQVPVGVFYRVKTETDDGAWSQAMIENFSGNVTGELAREIKSPTLEENVYEIAVVRFTDEASDTKIKDTLIVSSFTEIISAGLGYPYTALMGCKVRATDQLQGQLPTITSLVTGRIIQVPDRDENGDWRIAAGMFLMRDGIVTYEKNDQGEDTSTVLSSELDSVVWCLYDLLTNNRYGLGDYYPIHPDKRNIMLANFDYAAQYCDELVESQDPADPSGLVNGQMKDHVRKRFALNLVIDTTKSAADWVETIKAVCRASVYYSQGMFWIDIDRPKLPTQIFNMSNLKEYTQTGASYHGAPNVIEVQFPNPKLDFTMDVFRIESAEYMADPSIEENKKVMTMLGVTPIDQATALAKYAFHKSKLTKQISFKTGSEGIRCQANDVFGIAHDVPQWGAGGRITSYINEDDFIVCTTDVPIDADSITNNAVYVQDYQGKVHKLVIMPDRTTESSFTYEYANALIDSNFGFLPNHNGHLDTFSYGIAQFKVVSIQKDSDLLSTITATEYDSSLYALCDDTSDMSSFIPATPSQLPDMYRLSVDGVLASVTPQITNGIMRPVVIISYVRPATIGFKSVSIWMAPAGTTLFTCIAAETTSAQIEHLHNGADGDYMILVTANYTDRTQSWYEALADTDVTNRATVSLFSIDASLQFVDGVRELKVENSLDGSFITKDCTVVWTPPLVEDVDTPGVPVAEGTSLTNYLDYYKVEVFNIGDVPRREARVKEPKFTYSHEYNHLDGITRTFKIKVTAYDLLGRTSDPVTITCLNPAPPALI